MKIYLAILGLLVCGVAAEEDAPYPPSGWKPDGPSFELPQPGSVDPRNQGTVEVEIAKAQTLGQEYGPPEVDVTVQGLPVDEQRPIFEVSHVNGKEYVGPRNQGNVKVEIVKAQTLGQKYGPPEVDVTVQGLPVDEQRPIFEVSPVNGKEYVGPNFEKDLKILENNLNDAQIKAQSEALLEFARQAQINAAIARAHSNSAEAGYNTANSNSASFNSAGFNSGNSNSDNSYETSYISANTKSYDTENSNFNSANSNSVKLNSADANSANINKVNTYSSNFNSAKANSNNIDTANGNTANFNSASATSINENRPNFNGANDNRVNGYEENGIGREVNANGVNRNINSNGGNGDDNAANRNRINGNRQNGNGGNNNYNNNVRNTNGGNRNENGGWNSNERNGDGGNSINGLNGNKANDNAQNGNGQNGNSDNGNSNSDYAPLFNGQYIPSPVGNPNFGHGEVLDNNDQVIVEVTDENPQGYPPELYLSSLAQLLSNQISQLNVALTNMQNEQQSVNNKQNSGFLTQKQLQQLQQAQLAQIQLARIQAAQAQFAQNQAVQLAQNQAAQSLYPQNQGVQPQFVQIQTQQTPQTALNPPVLVQEQVQNELLSQYQPGQYPSQGQYPQQVFLQSPANQHVSEQDQVQIQQLLYQYQQAQGQIQEQPLNSYQQGLLQPQFIIQQDPSYQQTQTLLQQMQSQLNQAQGQVNLQSGLDLNQQGNGIEIIEGMENLQGDGGFGTRTQPRPVYGAPVPLPQTQGNPGYPFPTMTTELVNKEVIENGPTVMEAVAMTQSRRPTKLRNRQRQMRPIFTVDNSGHLVIAKKK